MATAQQVAETKQMVRESILEEGIDPNTLIQLGAMAQAVLNDKSK